MTPLPYLANSEDTFLHTSLPFYLKIKDYRQVMDTLGEKWLDYCFVEHRNTDYPHAHILAWSKSQVNQAERKRMYERVKELEQQRDRERAPEQQVGQRTLAQEQERRQAHDREVG